MYTLFNNKQIYEKDEVDSAIEGVVSTAANASNKAEEANTKANAALAETDRIKDAYNMAEQAFNKMDTYDTAITNTLSAATNAITLSTKCSTKAQEALEKADVAYNRTPVKYVTALPEQAEDVIYGITHNDTVTTQSNTTFINIIGTYFMRQSEGKYITRNNYTVYISGAAVGSIFVSGENINCYTNKDFTDMLPDTYNTYDSYNFTIIESVDHTDYYVGNSTLNIVVKLATYGTVENNFISRTEKGAPSGIAILDTTGHIPYSLLPVNSTVFRGTWDASTGVYPTEHVTPGDFFIVTVAGTVDGVEYLVDDRIYWTGSSWNVTHAPEGVTSINGRKGIVVLTAADVGALPTGNPGYTGKLSGEGCNATGNGVAHGTSTTAGNTQFAIGKYNYQQDSWAFMIGNGTSNAARKNAMGVTNDGVLYVHDIRCVYSDTLQSPAGECGVLTGHTYVYNSEDAGHNSVSHSTNNHETFTLILQTVPANNLIIQCNITPDADGTIDTFAVHNINILNLTSSTVTIYVSTVNASGTRVEKSVSLPASTKKSVIAIGNELYDLNIPNAIWN